MGNARLRRVEQVERNREQLLAAARRVFVARGYTAATLDAIADEAGFSKGVVYSQFASKADLFLALLERRIDERAAEHDRLVARLDRARAIPDLLELARRTSDADPRWDLAVLEFRIHAARDPATNARYAAAHRRTVARLADVLGRHAPADTGSPANAETMALFVLAFGAGAALERAAFGGEIPERALRALLARALGAPAAAAPRVRRRRGGSSAAGAAAPRARLRGRERRAT